MREHVIASNAALSVADHVKALERTLDHQSKTDTISIAISCLAHINILEHSWWFVKHCDYKAIGDLGSVCSV